MSRGSKPVDQIKMAKKRIKKLFLLADEIVNDDKILANRYVEIARKIGMRYNVRINKDLRKKYCKKCYSFLKPGLTCKNRVRKGFVEIECLNCGHKNKYPYK